MIYWLVTGGEWHPWHWRGVPVVGLYTVCCLARTRLLSPRLGCAFYSGCLFIDKHTKNNELASHSQARGVNIGVCVKCCRKAECVLGQATKAVQPTTRSAILPVTSQQIVKMIAHIHHFPASTTLHVFWGFFWMPALNHRGPNENKWEKPVLFFLLEHWFGVKAALRLGNRFV